MQLILSALYQIDYPTGNIPHHEALKIAQNRAVKRAIPLSYGDNYKGVRIVGTDSNYVAHFNLALQSGKWWDAPLEAVVGATTAKNLNLKLKDELVSSHGFFEQGDDHHTHPYYITGILAPSGTVADQLILTSLESVWDLHEHDENESHQQISGKKENPEVNDTIIKHQNKPTTAQNIQGTKRNENDASSASSFSKTDSTNTTANLANNRDITALLVGFKNPLSLLNIPRAINEKTNMQAATPAIEINKLLNQLGVGLFALQAFAVVVILIAGASLFVALYNALQERRYELALLRCLGARAWQVAAITLLESAWLTVLGLISGVILARITAYFLAKYAATQHQYFNFSPFHVPPGEVWLVLIAFCIGILAAILPAIRAYRTNLSQTLANA
ncbi:MAG: ABC transporter permease [Sphingobacteriales bacterium]|nr:ABC transporter permease [Sphingobacteriales bacterium]